MKYTGDYKKRLKQIRNIHCSINALKEELDILLLMDLTSGESYCIPNALGYLKEIDDQDGQ